MGVFRSPGAVCCTIDDDNDDDDDDDDDWIGMVTFFMLVCAIFLLFSFY